MFVHVYNMFMKCFDTVDLVIWIFHPIFIYSKFVSHAPDDSSRLKHAGCSGNLFKVKTILYICIYIFIYHM